MSDIASSDRFAGLHWLSARSGRRARARHRCGQLGAPYRHVIGFEADESRRAAEESSRVRVPSTKYGPPATPTWCGLFHDILVATEHAVYEVSRIPRPRKDGPTKMANASRSMRTLATGTRDDMLRVL